MLKDVDDDSEDKKIVIHEINVYFRCTLADICKESNFKKIYDHFKDYNTLELTQILVSSLQNKHLYITKEALQQCMIIIKNAQKYQDFGKGFKYLSKKIKRFAVILLVKLVRIQF